jgi:hypothetical protein
VYRENNNDEELVAKTRRLTVADEDRERVIKVILNRYAGEAQFITESFEDYIRENLPVWLQSHLIMVDSVQDWAAYYRGFSLLSHAGAKIIGPHSWEVQLDEGVEIDDPGSKNRG